MTKNEKIAVIKRALALYRAADVITESADEILRSIGVDTCSRMHRSFLDGKTTEVHVYKGFDDLVEIFDADTSPRVWPDGRIDNDYREFEALDALFFMIRKDGE